MKYALGIGVPFTLFWLFGFPLYIFRRLYTQRKNLNDKDVILNYGLFFVGLEEKAFFWEILVSNMRKLLYIFCGAFLTSASSSVKVSFHIIKSLERR